MPSPLDATLFDDPPDAPPDEPHPDSASSAAAVIAVNIFILFASRISVFSLLRRSPAHLSSHNIFHLQL
ncbi:hypothetical protein BALAC2494_01979 [Bifidobacterium animalis subsp. lactis CNCM I-2494]|uniref:Uncharacterized protein n=1 Tax=Bifidobacterium animalis subsp. lactis CNCM I-2494 TaxID=1042403 RepID=A0A806FVQ3_BIFAN|nr:hypothetical protein BALAC2494_01979 [Bifidobacterium animalis subsp. lactis CNCM I-2494]